MNGYWWGLLTVPLLLLAFAAGLGCLTLAWVIDSKRVDSSRFVRLRTPRAKVKTGSYIEPVAAAMHHLSANRGWNVRILPRVDLWITVGDGNFPDRLVDDVKTAYDNLRYPDEAGQ